MSIPLAPYRAEDRDALLGLVRDAALALEFDALAEPDYLDHKLAEPFCDRDTTLLARVAGALALAVGGVAVAVGIVALAPAADVTRVLPAAVVITVLARLAAFAALRSAARKN